MQQFEVEEVKTREALDAAFDCIWAAFQPSDVTIQHIFFPVLKDHQTTFEEARNRLWRQHISDPNSHWIFVRDTSSSQLRVIGCCQWRFYQQNPFEHGMPDDTPNWFPEGEEREFAAELIARTSAIGTECMARPHAGLYWMSVRPEHQRKGIGTALMSWGNQRADEYGLESYMEASAMGCELYKRCGYQVVKVFNICSAGRNEGKVWKQLESKYLPFCVTAMWRPVGGVWTEEEPNRTWAGRLKNLKLV